MIGIAQLDNLTTDQMIDVINGKIKILVKDPNQIQTEVKENYELGDFEKSLLKNDTIITLLKMEIEHRVGLEYLAKRIQEIDDNG